MTMKSRDKKTALAAVALGALMSFQAGRGERRRYGKGNPLPQGAAEAA